MQTPHSTTGTDARFPVARRINGERLGLFGWSRAILLQLAHPLVAAGVAEHSAFRRGRFQAAVRLHHTVRAMLALTFGDDDARQARIDGILAIHPRVHGRLPETVGSLQAGTPYSAEDPELVLWVHATLLESLPLAYECLVHPLSEADHDAYCAESAGVAVALGARERHVPRTRVALRAYMDAMLGSGRIVVGPQARELADAVLRPPMAALVWPAAALNRLITSGLLPLHLRARYGFHWNPRRERRFHRALALIGSTRRVLPAPLALWPEARTRAR
jgi:uncharacterized protein (DUF2236 family)